MNALAADILVGVIVAVSTCYCVWRLGPRRMRDALRPWLGKLLPGRVVGAESASACNGCSGCALVGKSAGSNCAPSESATKPADRLS